MDVLLKIIMVTWHGFLDDHVQTITNRWCTGSEPEHKPMEKAMFGGSRALISGNTKYIALGPGRAPGPPSGSVLRVGARA